MSDDIDPKSDELHSLFGALREHVVEVAHDFVDRVTDRIEEYEKDDRFKEPSIGRMVLSGALQILNIVGSSLEPDKTVDRSAGLSPPSASLDNKKEGDQDESE